MHDVPAVAAHVVSHSQPRHRTHGVDTVFDVGGAGRHMLDAHAKIGRYVLRHDPAVLGVHGVVVDIQRRAGRRDEVEDIGVPGREERDDASVAIEHGLATSVLEVVSLKYVAGGRGRIAADLLAPEPLVADFELVSASEVLSAAGELAVVATVGIRRVEIRRVVLLRGVEREERRFHEAAVGAAARVGGELLVRVLRVEQQLLPRHSAVVEQQEMIRPFLVAQGERIDRHQTAREVGLVRLPAWIADRTALNRVSRGERRGHLELASLVAISSDVLRAGHRQRRRGFLPCEAAGEEEPEPILDDRAAERPLVHGVQAAHPRHAARLLERCFSAPGVVRQVQPVAAREQVAAAPGDGVHHAAAEASVPRPRSPT